MVDALFEVFDKNKDGSIFVNSFRKVIKQAIFTAVALVPAAYYKVDLDEAVDKVYDDVENITQELVVKIFGDELQRDVLSILAGWKKENVASLITNPKRLRARATVKIGVDETASMMAGDNDRMAS